ncbi:MAG: SAM-dependent methyltransferase [Nocardia sp.]|nr:SAM-dependent methyltransferase [Nocardia sp.]
MPVDSAGHEDANATVPTGVGRTAVMVAAVRASENQREDRLFTDPFAADFVEASGFGAFLRQSAENADPDDEMAQAGASFAGYAPIRTKFFDDYLRTATSELRQVVIVAAGLDTRALRLEFGDEVSTYELDSAEVLDFKQRVLDKRGARSHGRRIPVPVDLREDWITPLTSAGFDPAEPTAWLIEGLIAYLTTEQNDALLAAVTSVSAPGSMLSLEYLNTDAVALMVRAVGGGSRTEMGQLWSGGGVADPSEVWLARHGWTSRAYDTYDRAQVYGRPLPPLTDTPIDRFSAAARNSLIIARRD